MALQQTVAHVHAIAMYVQGLPEREREAAVNKQVAVLETMIKKLDGPGEVTIFKAEFSAKFHAFCSSEQLMHLHGLMHEQAAKMPRCQGSKDADFKQQDWHLTFWRKVPQAFWQEMISQEGGSPMTKLFKLFQYLYDNGLRIPSEKTYGSMLTLSYYASACIVTDTGEQMYNTIQVIKDNWKTFMTTKKAQDAQSVAQGFRQHFPDVSCPFFELDEVKFMTIFSSIPLRSTNSRAGNSSHGALTHKPLQLRMILYFA